MIPQLVTVRYRRPDDRWLRLYVPVLPAALVLSPLLLLAVLAGLVACVATRVSPVGALVPAQYGVICTHSPGDGPASALVSALRSVNLVVYERTETVDQFQILVGLKPS